MRKFFNKTKIICLLAGILFFVPTFAQRELEVTYPVIPGVMSPSTVKTPLPQYLIYWVHFSIIIGGIVVFGMLVKAGIEYLTAVDNPTKKSKAKDSIISSIIGLFLLFFAYIISTTINPQLIIFYGKPQYIGTLTLYSHPDCAGDSIPIFRDGENLEEAATVASVRFITPGVFDVELYSEENCMGDFVYVESLTTQQCINLSDSQTTVKCVRFVFKAPGVYLCNGEFDEKGKCKGEFRYFPPNSSIPALGDFNDKAKSIRIINSIKPNVDSKEECEAKNGYWNNNNNICYSHYLLAILHEHVDYKGACLIYTQFGDWNTRNAGEKGSLLRDVWQRKVSSIQVFDIAATSTGGGVTFFKDVDLKPEDSKIGPYTFTPQCQNVPEGFNDKATSMLIDGPGDYVAILFELACREEDDKLFKPPEEGVCDVFTQSISNFRQYPIGRCGCIFGVGCKDCLSSFMVFPLKK